MSITASEARRMLFPLIEQVNDDRTVVEIVSRRGNAVLMSADDYAALEETAYLLRSPENVRRLLTAYTDALEGRNLLERRDLAELTAMADDT
jgi:antitoxin YefM